MQGHEHAGGRGQPRRRVQPEHREHARPAEQAQDHHDRFRRIVLRQRLAEHEIAGVGKPRPQRQEHGFEVGPLRSPAVEQNQPDDGDGGGGIPDRARAFLEHERAEHRDHDGRKAEGHDRSHGNSGDRHALEEQHLKPQQRQHGRRDEAQRPASGPGHRPPPRAPREQGQTAPEHPQRADDEGRRALRGQSLHRARGAETQRPQQHQPRAIRTFFHLVPLENRWSRRRAPDSTLSYPAVSNKTGGGAGVTGAVACAGGTARNRWSPTSGRARKGPRTGSPRCSTATARTAKAA